MPFPSSTTYPSSTLYPGGPSQPYGGYLPSPVNTLNDYNVEYNGFLMGPGTAYQLTEGSDFLDMVAIKTMDVQRVWADGSYSGPDYGDVLLPSMPVDVTGSSSSVFAANVQAFINALGPQTSPVPLWVKLPGLPAQGIPAKTNKRSMPVKLEFNSQLASAAVQWRCPNPVWQSISRTVTIAANASAPSGMVFPLFSSATHAAPSAMDFGSTASSASAATLTNAGNTPAWPYIVFTGPAPSFSIVLDGNTVTYGQAVPAGQTVTIDYSTGLATLTGGVDRTAQLTARNFTPVTSSSLVTLSAASGTATVTTADMWR